MDQEKLEKIYQILEQQMEEALEAKNMEQYQAKYALYVQMLQSGGIVASIDNERVAADYEQEAAEYNSKIASANSQREIRSFVGSYSKGQTTDAAPVSDLA